MRSWQRVIGVVAMTCGPLVACSLAVDTSDLSGGGGGGSEADGPRGELDARAPDGGGPAANEGGGPGDGGIDAPLDGPAPPGPCIEGPNRFCDDFDQPSPGSKWSSTSKQRGQLTFDGLGLSMPLALQATVVGGSGGALAQLNKDFADNPTRTRCEVDLNLLELDNGAEEIDLLDIHTTLAGGVIYNVYFARFGGDWALAEYQHGAGGVNRSRPLGVALPMNTWFHLILDVVPGSATLTANGTTVTLDGLRSPTGSKRSAHTGITWASSDVSSARVLVDNVDCTTAL